MCIKPAFSLAYIVGSIDGPLLMYYSQDEQQIVSKLDSGNEVERGYSKWCFYSLTCVVMVKRGLGELRHKYNIWESLTKREYALVF